MNRAIFVSIALVCALAGPARAVPEAGPIGLLDDFKIALAGVVKDVQSITEGGPVNKASPFEKARSKALKIVAKIEKKVDGVKTNVSFFGELKGASKGWKLVSKKLCPLLTTLGLPEDCDVLRDALEVARERAAVKLLDAVDLGRSRLAKADPAKAIEKAAALIAAAEENPDLAKAFKALAKALKPLVDHLRTVVEEPVGVTTSWVIDSLTVAPAGRGIDLDKDGTPDNDVSDLVVDLPAPFPDIDLTDIIDRAIVAVMTREPPEPDVVTVPIVQIWGVTSLAGPDDLAFVGLLQAVDTDRDRSDNFSGTETFDAEGATDAEGHALFRTPTGLAAGGGYEFLLTGKTLELVGISIDRDVPFGIKGTATAPANTGTIGFGLPAGVLLAYVEQTLFDTLGIKSLPPAVETALNGILTPSLDLDGDGTDESMAVALEFTSVPCEVTTTD